MKTVWKFVLHPNLKVHMPVGAKPLYVGVQDNTALCIWAQVDTTAELEEREFVIAGTGHELPEKTGKYLGTVMFNEGELVFHVFDTTPEYAKK